jgi:hypothetical protein
MTTLAPTPLASHWKQLQRWGGKFFQSPDLATWLAAWTTFWDKRGNLESSASESSDGWNGILQKGNFQTPRTLGEMWKNKERFVDWGGVFFLSIIKHVTLQKIVAHGFQYDPCTSVRIVCLWTQAWIQNLQNMKQECQSLYHNIWSIFLFKILT